jgi:hypothetical protein
MRSSLKKPCWAIVSELHELTEPTSTLKSWRAFFCLSWQSAVLNGTQFVERFRDGSAKKHLRRLPHVFQIQLNRVGKTKTECGQRKAILDHLV